MNNNWPTRNKDLHIAELIMQEYAKEQNSETLGLFELVVNQKEKRMNFRLASWVSAIAKQFQSMYGINQGEFVTRQVVSRCIRQDQTIH